MKLTVLNKPVWLMLTLVWIKTSTAIAPTPHTLSPDEQKNISNLSSCATVHLKWGGWLSLATVRLRATTCSNLEKTKESEDFVLQFLFHRKIPGSYFRKQANKSFKKNRPSKATVDDQLLTRAQQFNEHYSDIKAKDEYWIVRQGGQTLTLIKNQSLITSTIDPQLATEYFNIWLGDEPGIPRLKKLLKEAMTIN